MARPPHVASTGAEEVVSRYLRLGDCVNIAREMGAADGKKKDSAQVLVLRSMSKIIELGVKYRRMSVELKIKNSVLDTSVTCP